MMIDDRVTGTATRCAVFWSLVAAALLLRLPGLFTDLWLDELWTLYIVNGFESAAQVFTGFQHSNNHHLNSLFFFVLGDRDGGALYRLPSLFAGIGAVPLAWAIARRYGRSAALFAALLTGGSYLMVHFSSEARGYAPVVIFALAAFLAARRYITAPGWAVAALFWLCCALGFLSHLMFIHAFAGFLAWAPWALAARRGEGAGAWAAAAGRLARLLVVPCAFFAVFWYAVVRKMEVGGAPGFTVTGVLVKTLSYAAGGPAQGALAVAVAAVFFILIAWAVALLARRGDDEWIFLAVAVFLAPAAFLLLRRPEALFVRYFLISAAFGYTALGGLACAAWRHPVRRRRAACLVLLALFLVGNGLNIARFWRDGRGAYRKAVRFMDEHTAGPLITVTADHDFRAWLPLMFYKRFLPEGRDIVYRSLSEAPVQGVDWFIGHRIGPPEEPLPRVEDLSGNEYALVQTFPYSDLSGCHWYLYRRDTTLARRPPSM